ncbi:MAG TPA: bifunctional hydroxymethylpyrimidine kinase/phosphomethylpyrimidine kinase [Gemmatimonadales bacterium]|jgi:hydroxymethylpyrimidine/phosphomethylpyrimidine kinase|nr:bifunctional hydroxymethylpyrimidine kinase/phosphomethylpyrimidine kinase [Gemmatimonadales bacterium]
MRIALTVAGSDSGGGAGIQADLKTFHQFGVFGTSVIAAVTAQNTRGVVAWEPVSRDLVSRQLDALILDLPPDGIKSGMLASAPLVETVAEALQRLPTKPYVLDPVLVATSGHPLGDDATAEAIRRHLVPLATLVTPNLAEAERLTGIEVKTPEQMEQAGRALLKNGAAAALLKGGHLEGDEVIDVLVRPEGYRRFKHRRIASTSTHGTGCTLSAAITAGLALGRPLERSVEDAIDYVQRAIAAAPQLGGGRGPLNHFVPAPRGAPNELLDG